MFTTIFSHINDLNELKGLAQEIAQKVSSAYEARAKELMEAAKVAAAPKQPTPPPAPVAPSDNPFSNVSPVERKPKREVYRAKKAPKKEQVSAPTTAATKTEEDVQISISDKNALKQLKLSFHQYNKWCWALYGDTKPLREDLRKKLGGKFVATLTDYSGDITGTKEQRFAGWLWKNEDVQKAADALGLQIKVA